MKSVLTALFEGEIRPSEQYIPKSGEYHKIIQENGRRCEEFKEILQKFDPALGKQFIQVLDGQLNGLSHEYYEMFLGGFRLGAKLMLEILLDDLGGYKKESAGK